MNTNFLTDKPVIGVAAIVLGSLLYFVPTIVARVRHIRAVSLVSSLNGIAFFPLLCLFAPTIWFLLGVAALWIPAMVMAILGKPQDIQKQTREMNNAASPANRSGQLLRCLLVAFLSLAGAAGAVISLFGGTIIWLAAEESRQEKMSESWMLGGVLVVSILCIVLAEQITKKLRSSNRVHLVSRLLG